MTLTILGSGTSCGVPQMGCHCAVCRSADPRDRRLRCSALAQSGGTSILIDCGPDLREQMLRADFCGPLDAVLITHEHYDHVGGIDDLRPLSYARPLRLYADACSCRHLRERLPYCLVRHDYPGVPRLGLRELRPGDRVDIGGVPVTALGVMHGRLPILGYRLGDLVYITDMSALPERTRPLLEGTRLLVVNALRHEPHATHQTVEQAVAFARTLDPVPPTYLTHMSHHLGLHAREDALLPPGFHFAYDGLRLQIS